jgi:RNA polymerase sigma-70 factor (ECF subfamily)
MKTMAATAKWHMGYAVSTLLAMPNLDVHISAHSTPEDSALVLKVLKGDDVALKELVDRHLPSVYTFCLRYTGSPDDAQDAAQETFLKAWRKLKRFDTKKSFRTWLFAIAKNTATDIMRKRKSVPFSKFDTAEENNVLTDTLADPEPLPDELFERASLASDARDALAQLPARDRAILSLRYEEEESFENIARILKIPANTVRSLHRRALIALRKLLETKR